MNKFKTKLTNCGRCNGLLYNDNLIVFQFSGDTAAWRVSHIVTRIMKIVLLHILHASFSLLLSERPFRLIEWLVVKLLSRMDAGEVRGAKEKPGWAHQRRITLGSCEKLASIYTSLTIHERNWKINRQLIPLPCRNPFDLPVQHPFPQPHSEPKHAIPFSEQ